jgi:predicted nuclease of predicted toxin-antitoxin system
MKAVMKFLADMPISPKTVEFLRMLRHDAIRLNEIGMESADDEEILEYAAKHDYVVLTMDLDFGGLLASRGLTKPSVITFRLVNPEVTRINNILTEMFEQIKEELIKGAMIIVEEFRIRIRNLPI